MNKKIIFSFFVVLALAGLVYFFLNSQRQKPSITNLLTQEFKKIEPSQTFLEYQDPVGFRFSYPDNLSISKNEIGDTNTYIDLVLYSKDISGSLNLKIADTKLKSLNEWLKAQKFSSESAKQAKFAGLDALEVTSR